MSKRKAGLLKKILISIAIGFISLSTSLTIISTFKYGLNFITLLQWLFISAPGVVILLFLPGGD